MSTAYEDRIVRSLMNYDHGYDQEINFYNSLPYTRDVSTCHWDQPQLLSGNIIKYYRYKLGKPLLIKVPEDGFEIPAYRLSIVDVEEFDEVENLDEDDGLLLEDNQLVDDIFDGDDDLS